MLLASLSALGAGLEIAAVWLTLAHSRGISVADRVATLTFVAVVLPAVGFGALIIARRPGNRVGWLLVAAGLVAGTSGLVQAYIRGGLGLPGIRLAAWVANWMWVALGLLLTFLLLLYPDGQLPSSRWRPVAWAAGIGYGLAAVCSALYPGLPGLPDNHNPIGLYGSPGQIIQAAFPVLNWLLLLLQLLALGSLLGRFRRSRGPARQQLKWLAYGAAPIVLISIIPLPAGLRPWREVASNVAAWALPASIAIAVLRYRLYDIDRLINRTVVYGVLTALLAGVYAGLVLLLGQVFGGLGAEPPSGVVAGATLVVAALFQPARRRIQAAVDRRFNRRRYDAIKTVEAFSGRLREEIDLDTLSAELLAVVDQTMEPTRVSLWLRPPVNRARPVSY
jgi:hypothetical protein